MLGISCRVLAGPSKAIRSDHLVAGCHHKVQVLQLARQPEWQVQ